MRHIVSAVFSGLEWYAYCIQERPAASALETALVPHKGRGEDGQSTWIFAGCGMEGFRCADYPDSGALAQFAEMIWTAVVLQCCK